MLMASDYILDAMFLLLGVCCYTTGHHATPQDAAPRHGRAPRDTNTQTHRHTHTHTHSALLHVFAEAVFLNLRAIWVRQQPQDAITDKSLHIGDDDPLCSSEPRDGIALS